LLLDFACTFRIESLPLLLDALPWSIHASALDPTVTVVVAQVGVGVAVGGTGVAVGGTGVAVGVDVGGSGVFVEVAVGGSGVFVGGSGVAVGSGVSVGVAIGGSGVAVGSGVGGSGVAVGSGVSVGVTVGGSGVAVGVAVGGTGVAVGGSGVGVGGTSGSTVHSCLAGVTSTFPSASMARTSKTWSPTASSGVSYGEVQISNAVAFSEHSNVEPGSLAENSNVAFENWVVAGGPEVIVVSGGVVSWIVQVWLAGSSAQLPLSSTAYTQKVWEPAARPV
jgi:hypothetical protein